VKSYRRQHVLTRTWIHIDMDMFFAAVEIRDNPNLEGKPVAVGDHKMIQTTNYLAREYGVTSGLPGFIGKKLCPTLAFVEPNFDKYRAISEKVKDILRQYDSIVEGTGYDEGAIDVTDYLGEHGLNDQEGRIFLADKIRREIKETTGLTCSAGIASNKLLAKICSGMRKPDQQTYLDF